MVVPDFAPFLKTTKHWSLYGRLSEGAFGDLVFKLYDTVGGEVEERRAGCVQMYPVHELLARILVAYIDIVVAVDTGVRLPRVDLENGDVQGALTGFGREGDGRSPDELPEDTLLLRSPLSSNLVAQGP